MCSSCDTTTTSESTIMEAKMGRRMEISASFCMC